MEGNKGKEEQFILMAMFMREDIKTTQEVV
jgi:hypothetical protein